MQTCLKMWLLVPKSAPARVFTSDSHFVALLSISSMCGLRYYSSNLTSKYAGVSSTLNCKFCRDKVPVGSIEFSRHFSVNVR